MAGVVHNRRNQIVIRSRHASQQDGVIRFALWIQATYPLLAIPEVTGDGKVSGTVYVFLGAALEAKGAFQAELGNHLI